ncbi:MAG: acetate uptake transporter [Solirubrobacteraceae bacterium]|jgi:succinate-acetate transporter protein
MSSTSIESPPYVGLSSNGNNKAAAATPLPDGWANSGPLCLFAFAATTFMISMVNAGAINKAIVPVVIGVGLLFGGATQLVGGLIQLRTGNTFNGALFSTFGAFWIALAAILEWFSKAVPATQVGHAMGLLLYTFAILAFVFLLCSLRTTRVSVIALTTLTATLLLLAAGNYGASSNLLHLGGYLGIVLAAMATYMGAAEICEYSYGRSVLPLGPLGDK